MDAELPDYEEWVALGRPDLLTLLGVQDTDPVNPHKGISDAKEWAKAIVDIGITDDPVEAEYLGAELLDIATYHGRKMKAQRLYRDQKV